MKLTVKLTAKATALTLAGAAFGFVPSAWASDSYYAGQAMGGGHARDWCYTDACGQMGMIHASQIEF